MKLICLVDDDPIHLKIVDHTLTAQGYLVKAFNSGSTLLNHSFSEPIFAIILDHYLKEEKTGLDYLKEFKKKMPKVPVIYMTNETDEALIQEIMKNKAVGYIAKDPASLVRLRTLLDQISENSNASWLKKLFK